MNRKELVYRLLYRRKHAESAMRKSKRFDIRERARGRLQVINWALAALGTRSNRPKRTCRDEV